MLITDALPYIKKAVQTAVSKMFQYFQYIFSLDPLLFCRKQQNVA